MDFETLINYYNGKAGPEDAMEIDRWINQSVENRLYFDSLYQTWLAAGHETYRLEEVREAWVRFVVDHKLQETKPLIIPLKSRIVIKWTIAAGIIFLLTTGIWGFYYSRQSAVIVARNTKLVNEKIQLPDHSVVALYPAARLQYNEDFTENRLLQLQGNASFAVLHDDLHPFIVQVGNVFVKDIGTVFEIIQTKGKVTVNVFSGKVAFYDATDTIKLTAGGTATYLTGSGRFVWQSVVTPSSFDFKDILLSDALNQIETYFGVTIHYQHAALKNYRFTSTLKEKSLKEILDVVSNTFGLQYNIKGMDIYLSADASK